MKKEFEQDEVILYEGLVKYGNLKKCVKFTLTNKKLTRNININKYDAEATEEIDLEHIGFVLKAELIDEIKKELLKDKKETTKKVVKKTTKKEK